METAAGVPADHYRRLVRQEDKESDPLAPMSKDAVFNLLKFHHRLESPEGFDYALVDRSACGDVINRLELPPTLEILQPAGNECYAAREISAPGNTFDFRRQGSQRLFLDTITCYKYLPIKPSHVSDLQYMFMVQGRHGHAGSKCPFCDATRPSSA